MEYAVPRLVFAGTGSGCGKTTVTCAVLQAMINRRLNTGAFKCGPDYIDPMFHSRIIGAKSVNLDLCFFEENTLNYLLARNGSQRDINIIEGVMGFYDGIGLTTTEASTYEIARCTESPVVLIVGAKGAALSVLATIQGFLDFCPDNQICGVILNQCTAMTYSVLESEIRTRFSNRIQPLGFLPAVPECSLESRHLGLVTAAEVKDLQQKLDRLAREAETSIHLDGLLQLAAGAPNISCEPVVVSRQQEEIRIAVAMDEAFCFYYEDSLDLLREMGAKLIPFSPLTDGQLPADIHGLYLGGGYPELYTKELSENQSMRVAIRTALQDGLPCIAECGGFMYLTGSIHKVPMAGYLPGDSFDTGRLVRFGYVQLTADRDNMLCKAGEQIAGHEFHHWDSEDPGDGFTAVKKSGKSWSCIHATDTLYAGYPHFHFYSNPDFAVRFYQACLKEKHRYERYD